MTQTLPSYLAASAGATTPTPPFRPISLDPPTLPHPDGWIPLLASPCHFTRSTFLTTLKDLCLHPERNSSLILRADSLPPRPIPATDIPLGHTAIEEVRVRLMPRQPNRDGKLLQRCLFFRADGDPASGTMEEGTVLYLPEVDNKVDIPFYYPPVKGLKYSWIAVEPDLDSEIPISPTEDEVIIKDDNVEIDPPPPVIGRISISYLPWPEELPTLTPNAPIIPSPPNLSPGRTLTKRRSPLSAPPIIVDKDDPTMTNGETETKPLGAPAVIMAQLPVTPLTDNRKDVERVSRIAKVLLETVYKHGFGHMVGYKKRVHHDIIVPRDSFQDLYLTLKDRHRHLDSRAPKAGSTSTKIEDVKRHVFKNNGLPDDPSLPTSASPTHHSLIDLSEWGEQDVAIAAFLMLLWKEEYPRVTCAKEAGSGEEWDTWGRPPGGFVDLGCGNGLLVHILTAEGYTGKGYELRKRRTWPAYPPETQANLIELPIDFPSWFPNTLEEWESNTWIGKEDCPIKEGIFIIGNHADEITPWIPLLSLLPSTPVPFLSLPCCAHTLDSPFTLSIFTPPPHPHSPVGGFEAGLEAGQSRYKAYLMWLGYQGLLAGWEWEKEGLRVPSTRGWGIVGRNRWTKGDGDGDKACREWALGLVNQVRARGAFKVREKEGKDH